MARADGQVQLKTEGAGILILQVGVMQPGDGKLKEDGRDLSEIAILDSGSHKNVMGRRWMEGFTSRGEGTATKTQESMGQAMIFILGDGRRIQSEGQYHLSMFIRGTKTRLAMRS